MTGKLHTVVTLMEMSRRPPRTPADQPPQEALLMRVIAPEIAFYRYLFAAVGEPWLWWSRTVLPDGRLREIIHDPRVEVHALYVEGQPAGFFELDRRAADQVELTFCGLAPRFIGRRLGAFLVQSAVAYAWAPPNVGRVWLNSCSLDHPKALSFYERHGFARVGERVEIIDDPRLSGKLPRTAGWLSPNLPQIIAA